MKTRMKRFLSIFFAFSMCFSLSTMAKAMELIMPEEQMKIYLQNNGVPVDFLNLLDDYALQKMYQSLVGEDFVCFVSGLPNEIAPLSTMPDGLNMIIAASPVLEGTGNLRRVDRVNVVAITQWDDDCPAGTYYNGEAMTFAWNSSVLNFYANSFDFHVSIGQADGTFAVDNNETLTEPSKIGTGSLGVLFYLSANNYGSNITTMFDLVPDGAMYYDLYNTNNNLRNITVSQEYYHVTDSQTSLSLSGNHVGVIITGSEDPDYATKSSTMFYHSLEQ